MKSSGNKVQKIWTVGHSTRSLIELVDLLGDSDIHQLVDVRSMPGSRKFPQFNEAPLRESLQQYRISYEHLEKLGGRRKRLPDAEDTAWRNKSFEAYANYMKTAEFKEGLQRLKDLAVQKRTAIMCSEAVWWRCHRSLIADELKLQGWEVLHIMGFHQEMKHPYTSPAKVIKGKLSYAKD